MRSLFLVILGASLFLAVPATAQSNMCYKQTVTDQGCTPIALTKPLPVIGNSNVPTYGAAVVGLANTVAGDVYCITGSATKTVEVKGIRVSAIATSAIVGDVSLVLRSALDSGGGLASVPVIANDQQNAAATAVVNSFTSAPTPGAAIGTIRSRKMAAATQGNAATTSEALFQFSVYWDQAIVLRGANQQVCVNVSAFGTGASWDIDHEHTEE